VFSVSTDNPCTLYLCDSGGCKVQMSGVDSSEESFLVPQEEASDDKTRSVASSFALLKKKTSGACCDSASSRADVDVALSEVDVAAALFGLSRPDVEDMLPSSSNAHLSETGEEHHVAHIESEFGERYPPSCPQKVVELSNSIDDVEVKFDLLTPPLLPLANVEPDR
jgi:hypothetical protein